MIKKLLVACLIVVAAMMFGGVSYAASPNCDELGVDTDLYREICGTGTEADLQIKIANALNVVYLWVGIITVIVVIIGGIYYTISLGDPSKVAKAKNTILYAVIGLVITLLAFAITNFVLNAVR